MQCALLSSALRKGIALIFSLCVGLDSWSWGRWMWTWCPADQMSFWQKQGVLWLFSFSPTALPMRKTAQWSPEMAVDQWHVRVGSRAAAHCLAGTSLRVSTVCCLCGKSWVEDLFLIFLHVLCNCLCAATFVEWWTAVSKANCFWTVKIKPVLQRWWILRKHCGPWECMIWTSK